MSRIFSLANPEFNIQGINQLVDEWQGAALTDLARQIGFQDQFRQLYLHIFQNLQSVPSENQDLNPRFISLSVRAGAIKTYVLISVSIAEGALAALGEERILGNREGELYSRTFGRLLDAWEVDDGEPRQEISSIWQDLQLLKRYRNYIHLNQAVREQAEWQEILDNEQLIINAADNVIYLLRELCHIFRDP